MKKERKFVIGDIHGYYDEMMELFEVVQFDFETDSLISLGDLVDRGPKPIKVVEKLMTVKNLIHILGNHDEWCYQYLVKNNVPDEWVLQGGKSTLESYRNNPEYRERHAPFFEKAKLYHIDKENRLFVHGGFNPEIPFSFQCNKKELLIWDRSLVMKAVEYKKNNHEFPEFSEIFIGHTPTQLLKEHTPKKLSNLWMLDTGIHISGKLTIMNIETKEFWQSNFKKNEKTD